ncbi:hypothetical protein KSF_107930 [Reticulibacter mediterranei]|uniref:Uncharacterized protein n=1 Tax=Reticulibacter mediterranei TaxID=2778369 RepID=A0A8J3IYD2_9CHLR|nr:hypothetical protein [Reticulibacter mediterranei]GHP00746.1 hypothetical protein KSF_107930 [Reticulibacter mediterranei]
MLWQLLVLIAVGFAGPTLVTVGVFVISQDRLRGPLLTGSVVWGVIVLIATPLVYDHFRHEILTFNENLNTVVIAVKKVPTVCIEDGSCRWTYQCHPYIVTESYLANESYQAYDSTRKKTVTKYRTVTKHRTVTKYHSCPYSLEEDEWQTVTSLKTDPTNASSANVTITEASHHLPDDPSAHLWREYRTIPVSILNSAGVGAPEVSKHYQQIIRTGSYPAISIEHGFENYLLSDPETTMRPTVSQDELVPYQQKGLLPKLHITPDEEHAVNKVYFVGMKPPANALQWQNAVAHFNAEAGALRQMDLHLVILPESAVGDLHQYAIALRGYWSDTSIFGHSPLPKNALVVVFATDGQVVKRAEVFTLMPPAADGVSNTLLFQDIQDQLPGQPLQPETLLGDPQPIVSQVSDEGYDVKYRTGSQGIGLLEYLLITGPHHFQRVPMASFRYLKDEILPSTDDCIKIFLIVLAIGLIAGGGSAIALFKIANR